MYPIFEWNIMLNFIVSREGEERAQTLHLNFVSTMKTVLWGGQNVKLYWKSEGFLSNIFLGVRISIFRWQVLCTRSLEWQVLVTHFTNTRISPYWRKEKNDASEVIFRCYETKYHFFVYYLPLVVCKNNEEYQTEHQKPI